MSTRSTLLGVSSAAVILLVSGPGRALTLVDPTLVVTVFSTAPTHSVAIPGPAAPSYGSFLYALSRTVSPRIDELVEFDADGSELSRGVIALDAASLQMGANAFAGRLFASERGLPAEVPDGVYEIAPDRTVSLFSSLGGGNPDPNGIAFGAGGSFGDFMYVANATAGSNDANVNRAIARIGSDGAVLGALATDANGPFHLAFPTSSAYGDYLYFTLVTSNQLLRVDAEGNVEPFAILEEGETAIDLAFGLGGALGNALYATVNNPGGFASRRLVRILADGTVETVGTGLGGFRFDIDPASGDLFLADEAGGILRISAIPEPGVAVLLGAGLLALAGGRRGWLRA
jgi:hypothetical protein